jgi:hypothetical protein
MTRPQQLLFVVALLGGGIACETDLLEDPGFQLWCGERLCQWDTVEGEIQRVSTWHEHDYGVELVGAPVVLRQPLAGTHGCALVEAVADVDPAADVTIAIDQDGDGNPEWMQALATDGFEASSWEVDLDVAGEGFASMRKSSPGKAVIGRLRVSTECVEELDD